MRRLLLCALVMAASAQAELLSSPGRLWLTGGGSFRDHLQFDRAGQPFLRIGGNARAFAPWNVHLSGAYFFNGFLGVNFEGRGELFYATQPATTPVPQPAFELTPSVAARWLPVSSVSLEAQLGWAVHLRSVIAPGPRNKDVFFMSPSFGVAVGLSPSRYFAAQLFFRAQPLGIALSKEEEFQAVVLSGGTQLSVAALRLGPAQLGAALSFEVSSATAGAVEGRTSQLGLRFGVGLSVMRAPPEQKEVIKLEPVAAAAKVTLAGLAVSSDGSPLPGVVVTLDGESPARSDSAGAFTFAEVLTGPHVLRARKDGFKAASLEVPVTASPVPVTLILGAPTGPGRLRGVVRSSGGAVTGATVLIAAQSAVSDGEGKYVLEDVGPGPVTVHVSAADFTDAEELAQVPPEGEATLDFTLVPRAAEVRATLRGLIRSKSGETLKATVRVVELKLKLTVKADGRFSAEVPSGKYTLVIESRGYLPQTKTVEVSGGDQAIFHAELEKLR